MWSECMITEFEDRKCDIHGNVAEFLAAEGIH
jgi:hypothetical protein